MRGSIRDRGCPRPKYKPAGRSHTSPCGHECSAHLGKRAAAQLGHGLAEALVQGGGPAQPLLGIHGDAQRLLILQHHMRVRLPRQRRPQPAAGRSPVGAVCTGQHLAGHGHVAAAVLAAVVGRLAGHRCGRQRHRRRQPLGTCTAAAGAGALSILCTLVPAVGRGGRGRHRAWNHPPNHTHAAAAPGLPMARTGEEVAGAIVRSEAAPRLRDAVLSLASPPTGLLVSLRWRGPWLHARRGAGNNDEAVRRDADEQFMVHLRPAVERCAGGIRARLELLDR